MVDLSSCEPKGDKKNSCFFEDNLARVYERRSQSGLTQLVGAMAAVVIQVDHGDGLAYKAELALMGPEVVDGEIQGEKNVDFVVDVLRDLGISFLADVVGECTDQPNLKQIFSKASPYSLLITEYVERCLGYDGFFTRDNVAALTAAAGEAERYQHGHVFD